MARLASQAKAGYYPTPDSVLQLIKKSLTFDEGARLLDPCCGEGLALASLTNCTTPTYGIELSHLRAQEARKRLHTVLWGDALTEIRYTYHTFGLLFLNPPYDVLSFHDQKSCRMETRFLYQYTPSLQPGGWLIFVIPYYLLADEACAETLGKYFTRVQVWAFPEDDFQAFKQCVVCGMRKNNIPEVRAAGTKRRIMELGQLTPEEVLNTALTLPSMDIPAAKKPLNTFQAMRLDPATCVPVVHKAGILRNALTELIPQQRNAIRPLAMLENGHLALILAGGFMNGAVEKDSIQLVIKGMVQKSSPVVNDGTDGKNITTRDKYTPQIKVINMDTATIHIVA